jgi:MFS-type transporter involved in bile tolerance (Atg22 family)
LETINDDHFLGYCLITNTVTALIGTFLWGCLGDRLKIGRTMFYLIIVDLVIKIFGIFSTTKATLFMLMLFVGFTSRGMSTVSGPGLIEIFGLKIAT